MEEILPARQEARVKFQLNILGLLASLLAFIRRLFIHQILKPPSKVERSPCGQCGLCMAYFAHRAKYFASPLGFHQRLIGNTSNKRRSSLPSKQLYVITDLVPAVVHSFLEERKGQVRSLEQTATLQAWRDNIATLNFRTSNRRDIEDHLKHCFLVFDDHYLNGLMVKLTTVQWANDLPKGTLGQSAPLHHFIARTVPGMRPTKS